MRPLYPFILFALFPFFTIGQVSTGDCEGATVLCGDLYSEESAPPGIGNLYEYTGVCNQNLETMSLWYTFTVYDAGDLSFILTPNDAEDDYDWGLFNITTGGCEGIFVGGPSPEVSCNSWGSLAVPNGPTGISTANGGLTNSGGPGDQFGPPFNANLPVQVGETYALVVMNWSNSINGYSIDFAESTASLYDNEPPFPATISADCTNSQFVLTFSELLVSSSAEALDFQITGPQGTINISQILPLNSFANLEDEYILFTTEIITQPGTYTLTVTDVSGAVVDPCGNIGLGEVQFEISPPLQYQSNVQTACNGLNGSIEITEISGGFEPYSFSINGIVQNDSIAEDLTPGNYFLTITDDNGCNLFSNITLSNQDISVSIGEQDSLSCANPSIEIQNVVVTPAQNANYTWTLTTDTGNFVLPDNSANATATFAGIYSLQISNTENGCTAVDTVEIIATEINDLAFETNINVDCNNTGGSIEVVNISGGAAPYEVQIDGVTQDGTFITTLVANTYNVVLIDANGCSISQLATIPYHELLVKIVEPDTLDCNLPTITIGDVLLSDFDNTIYQWNSLGADGQIVSGSNTLNPVFAEAGLYELVVTDTLVGCINSDTIQVISVVPTDFNFQFDVTSACNSVDGAIEVTTINSGTAPYSLEVNGISQSNLLVEPLNAGDYTLILTDSHGCMDTALVEVPSINITVSVPEQEVLTCENPSFYMQGVEINSNEEIGVIWYLQTFEGWIPQNPSGTTLLVDQGGIYQIEVTTLDLTCAAYATFEILYSDESNLSFTTQTEDACNGIGGSIAVENIAGGTEPYEFILNNNQQIDFVADDLNAGNYFVTIMDDHNCVLTQTVTVQNHPLEITLPEQERITCNSPSVSIFGVQIIPDQDVNYSWEYVTANGNIPTGDNSTNPILSATGEYLVTVINEESGCETSTSFFIESGDQTVVDLSHMSFPNIITANKDSKNEYWVPYLDYDREFDLVSAFDVYDLQVFDRWGQVVFDSKSDNSRRWSITDENEGTYFYVVSYSTECGGKQSGKHEGSILLVK